MSKLHPDALDRAEPGRNEQRSQDEQRSDRSKRDEHPVLVAPPEDGGQNQECSADCETEATAFCCRQSSWNSLCQFWVSFHSGWPSLSSRYGQTTRASMCVRMKHW